MSLTGAEIDTLYKLGKYGSQEDGDLPSKSGMYGLVAKGFAKQDYRFDKSNHITHLGIERYNRIFGGKDDI